MPLVPAENCTKQTSPESSVTPTGASFAGFSWRPLGRRTPVIDGLDLDIEPGQKVLLAGPSGAGKSTILHALAGALGTTLAGESAGTCRVDGRIGMVLQNPGDAIVAERIGRDIAFGPENLELRRTDIWARVDSARQAVHLPYEREHLTSALSGGETQRLALAGALALQPGLLLLDEPTSMLDEAHAQAVREAVVSAITHTGATLVVVEHQIEPWLDLVDRVVVLSSNGKVVADCEPESFVAKHRDSLGAEGVWMPGLAAPSPAEVPVDLVQPLNAPPTLRARRLSVDLTTRTLRGSTTTRAVSELDATVAAGLLTAFTGPSGAGKSTALAAFGGLIAPTSGSICGVQPAIHKWPSRRLATTVGWAPQNPEHGFMAATVRAEVMKSAERLGIRIDAEALLDVFSLGHLEAVSPYRLSGGEQRRLALLAALAHRPGVLLLDEPTVGQDRNTWAAVAGFIGAARAAGAAIAVSTHDTLLSASADAQVAMVDGRSQ